MRRDDLLKLTMSCGALVMLCSSSPLLAQEPMPEHGDDEGMTHDMGSHEAMGEAHEDPHTDEATPHMRPPKLPAGMTLDEVLARAASAPPESYPHAIHDDQPLAMLLFDWFDYRLTPSAEQQLAWEANAWVGGPFNRLVLKPEGELNFTDEGAVLESENDLMYGRLFAPFWSVQAGLRYSNSWHTAQSTYEDHLDVALAVQGLAPGRFEVELSTYVALDGNVMASLEASSDWRLTQRLVFQPRATLGASLKDRPERALGAGLTQGSAEARLRYEIRRQLAPFLGVAYQRAMFGTADLLRAEGEDPAQLQLIAGLRFGFF